MQILLTFKKKTEELGIFLSRCEAQTRRNVESVKKRRKHERNLRATYGGDEAQISVMSSWFPERLPKKVVAQFPGARKTLFPSNRGPLFW